MPGPVCFARVREFLYVIRRNVNRCPLWWWTLIFSPFFIRYREQNALCVCVCRALTLWDWAAARSLLQRAGDATNGEFWIIELVCRWIILNRPLLPAPASPVPARSRIRPHGAPPLHKFISLAPKLRGSFNREPPKSSSCFQRLCIKNSIFFQFKGLLIHS